MPIVWHVIQLYAIQGFSRFVLATGYRGASIERFVGAEAWPTGVSVACVDTGAETNTGGRLKLLESQLDGGRFCVTYADGVADIDLEALLRFHDRHRALATMTVVRPRLYLDTDSVLERAPLERLAGEGQLRAYRHEGFWDCMDTYKDAVELNDLWAAGDAPWRRW
jgi:glucose-1-phosphate cytidylyltransferase